MSTYQGRFKWQHMRAIQVARRHVLRLQKSNPRQLSSYSNSLLGKLEKGLKEILDDRWWSSDRSDVLRSSIASELDKVVAEILHRSVFGEVEDK